MNPVAQKRCSKHTVHNLMAVDLAGIRPGPDSEDCYEVMALLAGSW